MSFTSPPLDWPWLPCAVDVEASTSALPRGREQNRMIGARVEGRTRLEHDDHTGQTGGLLAPLINVRVVDESARARRREPRYEGVARRNGRRDALRITAETRYAVEIAFQ